MLKLQISFPIWLLFTFLSIGCCVTSFLQAQAAAVTDLNEVIILKSLAQKWSTDLKTTNSNTWKTPWNLTGDPCTGRATDSTDLDDPTMNPAFKCDCSFNNGATCHITKMKVYAVDIKGEIPKELANLTYLSFLKLDQNYLTGPIPAFLGDLTQMDTLSIALNKLSGPVPKQLGNLHKLTVLSFGHNDLNGTLPPELGNLTALEELYVDSSGVRGEIPSTFGKLQKLTVLWASDNLFTGGIPDFIGTWKNLVDLRLQGNAFKGPIPSSFSNLTSLTNMRVSDITSGVSSLSFLKSLKNLTTLVLRNNRISGEVPSYIGEFIGLQILDLSFNNFTGGIPDSLQNLSSLTFLFLGNNNLSGKLPSEKSASLKYIGYMSPEYAMRGHLTEKLDVFSFGVVALELVSGRSNTDTSLPEKMVHLLEWTWHLYEKGRLLELMDPDIESTCSKEEVLRVIEVALLCTQAVPTMRPSMSRVVAMLTGDAEIIPSASRPAYIKDLQYNNVISGATGTGSTPVIVTTPLHNSAESSSILSHDSLTMSSAERECNSIKD